MSRPLDWISVAPVAGSTIERLTVSHHSHDPSRQRTRTMCIRKRPPADITSSTPGWIGIGIDERTERGANELVRRPAEDRFHRRRRVEDEPGHRRDPGGFSAVRARAPFGRRRMWGQLADDIGGTALWTARAGDLDQRSAWKEAQAILDHVAETAPELRVRSRPFPVRWEGDETLFQVRGTCCLWYTTFEEPDRCGEGYCTTCPLRDDDVRHERLCRYLAELLAGALLAFGSSRSLNSMSLGDDVARVLGLSSSAPCSLPRSCTCSPNSGAPTELPVGIVTGIIGAPYLLWLLARANRIGAGG